MTEADTNKLYLRHVNEADADLLFQWANDPDVRKNSFHQEPISYETHKRWFAEHLKDVSEIQYILMEGTDPAGQIRFSVRGDEAEIGYSIDSEKRGRGYGEKMILLATEKMRADHPEVKRFTAKVKPDNPASARCFHKNGFRETSKQFELQKR